MMPDVPLLIPSGEKVPDLPPMKMLVVMHVHYVELLPEMMRDLNAIPISFDLCITSSRDGAEAAWKTCKMPEHLNGVRFIPTPNRGRDIAPWLNALPAAEHLQYDVALKIHGKKSANDTDRTGDQWRRFLLQSLVGSRAATGTALQAFVQDPQLGLVIPVFPPGILAAKPHAFRWNRRDLAICRNFLTERQLPFPPKVAPTPLFAAGSMFYYRPQALQKLLTAPPAYNDFPPEPLPRVGTLAHAIERLPVIIAQAAGYQVARILPEVMLAEAFLRYESAFLAETLPIQPTLSNFRAAVMRSLRWRLLKK